MVDGHLNVSAESVESDTTVGSCFGGRNDCSHQNAVAVKNSGKMTCVSYTLVPGFMKMGICTVPRARPSVSFEILCVLRFASRILPSLRPLCGLYTCFLRVYETSICLEY